MRSWDTVKKLIKGKTALISSACIEDGWTLQPPTLYQYQEEYGGTFSGQPNCVDRTNRLINAAKKIGNSYAAWSAPLHDLCHEHGHIAVLVPVKCTDLKGIQFGLVRSIKEFSDLAQASSEEIETGKISKQGAVRIVEEGRQALQQIAAYIAEVKALHDRAGT